MDSQSLLSTTTHILSRISRLKKDDILPLREIIREHNRLYHIEESPIISDTEYDILFHALARLEADYNMLDENSPTAHLAILTSEQFRKVAHRFPMISLDNTYSAEEVRDFEERMRNILLKNDPNLWEFDYYIQPKYDGLWVALIYEYWILTQAVTRWSGVEWEDVTLGAREIINIPKNVEVLKGVERMEIRGEVMMSRNTFARVNAERAEMNEKLFANPRNAASGSLRQLNPLITRSRNLEFFAYSVPQIEQGIESNFMVESYHELMELLESWGFERKDFVFKSVHGLNALIELIEAQTKWYIGESIDSQKNEYFDFDIDWMVLKLDNMKLWDILGRTEHHPRYAIAYKFPAKQVRTRVNSIEHSVGRTGTVTPVANLEPVEVTGVIVKRATLHNYDELAKKWVREWDEVFIMRAGEVIPEIVMVLESLRNGTEKIVTPPVSCPVCNTKLEKAEGKVAIFCPNKHCGAKVQWQFEMFVSKHAMNIDWLWEKQIELFLEKGWITDFPSIYTLHRFKNSILELEWYKEKSVNNLISSIESSRDTTLERVFVALGIPNVGRKTARQIVQLFRWSVNTATLLEKLWIITEADLVNIRDVGPETAISFVEYIQNNKAMLERLFSELRINFSDLALEENTSNGTLAWKSFCVTGSFENISREEIHALIDKNSGEVRSGVSAKLDYLIAWEKAGSKMKKAEELSVQVITLEQFKSMLNN